MAKRFVCFIDKAKLFQQRRQEKIGQKVQNEKLEQFFMPFVRCTAAMFTSHPLARCCRLFKMRPQAPAHWQKYLCDILSALSKRKEASSGTKKSLVKFLLSIRWANTYFTALCCTLFFFQNNGYKPTNCTVVNAM